MSCRRTCSKKIFSFLAVLAIAFVMVAFVPHIAEAQSSSSTLDLGLTAATQTGLGNTDIRITIAKIIRAALGLLGIIALLLVLYGGFIFMTAGGNEEKIAQAKKILVNAGIGLVIILSAYAIVSFVMNSLVGATTGNTIGAGGTGNGGDNGGNDSTSFGQAFYVASLPQVGQVCIRNINPTVTFNKEVDLDTVADNIQLQEKSTNTAVDGTWNYGQTKNVIVFTPVGACDPSVGNDCLKAKTDYTLVFTNAAAIKTLDKSPELTLNCHFKAGCNPVTFTSGDGVDRLPPTVTIKYPSKDSVLEAGATVPVQLTYNDDNGVQNVSLSATAGTDQSLVDSVSFAGCKKTDTVTINWPTKTSYNSATLNAQAVDWAGQTGKDSATVSFKPNHCFDGIVETNLGEQQAGPPECGGECGVCSGGTCKTGADCASGTCTAGVCVATMHITGFSPKNGAVGTFVTIDGYYFGSKVGKVYFALKDNPDINNASDWTLAQIMNCGAASNNWSSGEIIVRVPAGATQYSHIKVETAPYIGTDGKQHTDVDATTNHPELGPFEVNTLVRPTLCSVTPDSGSSGEVVSLSGSGYGLLNNANDSVYFGDLKSTIAFDNKGQIDWADNHIGATVPPIDNGNVGLKVIKGNVESNSVRFVIQASSVADTPVITDITPADSPAGTYLTINGSNFGTKVGKVWFKASANSPAIIGDMTFPAQCATTVWTDNQIIVKFPVGKGTPLQSYVVQVNTADNQTSVYDENKIITLENGDPAPGICAITPASGPIPFPSGQAVQLFGDYFTTAANQTANVYFWKAGAAGADSIIGRTAASGPGVIKITANSAAVIPPADTISGPVSVYRTGDTKISNAVQFSAADCRDNTSMCGAGHCCVSGAQAGLCLPPGQLCTDQTISTGYVWRFATKTIPPVPHVVERCDANVAAGAALPSPSPSVQWDGINANGDQHNVCNNALITVEFTTTLDPSTVNEKTVVVNHCDAINDTTCTNPKPITLKTDSYTLKTAYSDAKGVHQYLSLQATSNWDNGGWYQVVLSNKITSPAINGSGVPLAADKACGDGTSYCFSFKAGAAECRLKTVLVTPYSFYTQVLEAPMHYHTATGVGSPVDYRAGGLSDQRCVMMDVSTLPWDWASGDKTFADIYGSNSGPLVSVSADANTVGVGVKNDSVAINANTKVTTSDGQTVKTGTSPLTVDLSNPQVTDYWPRCLQSCTNAEVGVRFNVSMSNRNLVDAISHGSVHLYKCDDENCISTEEQGVSKDIFLTDDSNGTVLEIANSSQTSKALEANTIYEVTISVSSTDLTDQSLLWSRARLDDPSSASKPYTKLFSWRFKTKASACTIDRADVLPKEFIARLVNDKSIYTVQPYSSPDTCSSEGQKLNPWSVGWSWNSSDAKVATITTFSTRGQNPYCTAACIRKGSDVSSAAASQNLPVCGNGIVESGEDCDAPNKANGCGLDCRFMGTSAPTCGNGKVDPGEACDTTDPKTSLGCSAQCLRTGSSATTKSTDVNAAICGNGQIGAGEDCDTGIAGSITDPKSSLGCSAACLHLGTHLSTKWCDDNKSDFGGFSQDAYKTACANAYSQCGDGVQNPDEDPGCDLGGGKHAAWCNDYCLVNNTSHAECAGGKEGCDVNDQNAGSSLNYTEPSVCGDGQVGTGEDAYCEDNLNITHDAVVDPWTIALAVGKGDTVGTPPAQHSNVSAGTDQQTKSGTTVSGKALFTMACGYRNDQDCVSAFGAGYGVGDNTCCFARPLISGTTPNDGDTNVCRNTVIRAKFNSVIDQNTLSGNILIAHGVDTATDCASGTIDVSDLVALAPVKVGNVPWYQHVFASVTNFFKSLVGSEVDAAFTPPSKWCAGAEQGSASVLIDPANTSTSYISINLQTALATSSYYAVILKDGIKDTRGVRITATNGSYIWKFQSASKVCTVDAITVDPSMWAFTAAGNTVDLTATAHTTSVTGAAIQPIPNVYDWNYDWTPQTNAFVALQNATNDTNTITAKNRNGEVDVRANAVVKTDIFSHTTGTLANGSAHIIVNLCVNPWPPLKVQTGDQTVSPFPFSDTVGNTSGFNITNQQFDGSSIPVSKSSSGSTIGDGYFHFRTYYCADSGSIGTFDDLPYLKPANPTSADVLQSNVGSCELTGNSCQASSDCGVSYSDVGTSYVVSAGSDGVCVGRESGNTTDHVFFDSKNQVIGCSTSLAESDCTSHSDFTSWVSTNNYTASCKPLLVAQEKPLQCYKNDPLKRFIFTNTNNSDAIGIQVFSNPDHLTPEEWYKKDKSAGGQGFVGNLQNIQVAGYDAVSDGNNIYVGGVDYTNVSKSLYSDIYLFSLSQNAKPETQKVFNQLITNLSLNTNLTYNDGYCGTSMSAPGNTIACSNDLDCPTGQVCVDQVDKLKRNYQRLRDLKQIETSIDSYANQHGGKFPPVSVGSFLPGQSLSVWDWAGLATEVGTSLPKDPINKLGVAGTCTHNTNIFCTQDSDCSTETDTTDTCTLHDATTGWSTADRRFSFACAPSSYAYRYQVDPTLGFTVRSHFEDFGLTVSNLNSFISGFHFTNPDQMQVSSNGTNTTNNSSSICNNDQEIETISKGTCGDGVVNVANNEQCDPPGSTIYDRSACNADGSGVLTTKTCNNSCQWQVTVSDPAVHACVDSAKCGNGRVDAGEQCDDGVQNGKWNKCTKQCTTPTIQNSTAGFCGDGKTQNKANGSDQNYELCDAGRVATTYSNQQVACSGQKCVTKQVASTAPVANGDPTYGIKKANSCSFDCQNYGPYCGDGVVQPQYGEECDPGAASVSCTVSGLAGKKTCTASCKYADTASAAWWSFDQPSSDGYTFADRQGVAPGKCDKPETCPSFDDKGSKDGKGTYHFSGTDFIHVADTNAIDPTSTFSIEAWIRPENSTSKQIIVDKSGLGDGSGADGGYMLSFVNGRVTLNIFSGSGEEIFATSTINPLELNNWSHIVATYEWKNNQETIKLYVNGSLDNSVVKNVSKPTLGATKHTLVIGGNGVIDVNTNSSGFVGSMNNLKIFGRVLQADEINDRDQNAWVCIVPQHTETTVALPGTCGDGHVDPGEACDLGLGQNGKQCTPGYGQTCQYCSADCKNTNDVRSTQFCGDGIIEGNEVCETDPTTGDVYAAASSTTSTESLATAMNDSDLSTHNGYKVLSCSDEKLDTVSVNIAGTNVNVSDTFKKGTKVCSPDCKRIYVTETNSVACVTCGLASEQDESASIVTGNIVNVVEPFNIFPLGKGQSWMQLYDFDKSTNQAGLGLASVHQVTTTYQLSDSFDSNNTPQTAYLNTAAICSTQPGNIYGMQFNGNNKNFFTMPIVKNPTTWQYDFALSPVIPQSSEPNNLRIVVTWIGDTAFDAGFVRPSSSDNSLVVEDTTMNAHKVMSVNYTSQTQSDIATNPWYIWFHGQSTTEDGLSEESFTIDTSKMSATDYMFYVRTASPGDYLRNIKNTARLKVDVYLPEDTNQQLTDGYRFSLPVRTFYLTSADVSSNQTAQYWHVFTINKSGATMNDKIQNAGFLDPNTLTTDYNDYPNGRIVTGVSQMR